MEISARQDAVRAPAIGADQRAVIDVRGQAAGGFVIRCGVIRQDQEQSPARRQSGRLSRVWIELGLWSG